MTEADDRAEQKREETTIAWDKADVPPIYRKMALSQLGSGAARVRAYLQAEGDESYEEDRIIGIGLYLRGKARNHYKMLPTLAKELVLLQDHVQFVSMRKLVNVLNGGNKEDYNTIMRVSALCVARFYDDSVPCPYSHADLSDAEDVLTSRIQNGKRNYLSASNPPSDAAWYSREFRGLVADSTREFCLDD